MKGPPCCHCGRKGRKLRPSRTDRNNMLCPPCWNRFGGSSKVTNRAAAKRRATGQ